MPAVTADTLTLPRLPEPAAGAAERPVASVSAAPSGFEGEGFPVRRAFAGVPLEALDPFIHLDQMASADGGALVRIIAGDVAGHRGPGATHTPITFLHATVSPGARLHLPWRPDFNALAYVLSGSGRAGGSGASPGKAGSEGRPVTD